MSHLLNWGEGKINQSNYIKFKKHTRDRDSETQTDRKRQREREEG